jgi:hypothetical protein
VPVVWLAPRHTTPVLAQLQRIRDNHFQSIASVEHRQMKCIVGAVTTSAGCTAFASRVILWHTCSPVARGRPRWRRTGWPRRR